MLHPTSPASSAVRATGQSLGVAGAGAASTSSAWRWRCRLRRC
jgi:hypothetical protein